MASFRGQEIYPMVSGDCSRYSKEVLRKKTAIFFEFVTLVQHFRDFSICFHNKGPLLVMQQEDRGETEPGVSPPVFMG